MVLSRRPGSRPDPEVCEVRSGRRRSQSGAEAMSDVIPDPAQAPTMSPPTGQVNLAELDDKHLSRYRHPNERAALVAIFIGMAVVLIGLWLARPHLGNILDFLPS